MDSPISDKEVAILAKLDEADKVHLDTLERRQILADMLTLFDNDDNKHYITGRINAAQSTRELRWVISNIRDTDISKL